MATLEGKVAVVTGAGGGIGAALVEGLAARGVRIVAADIAVSAAERVSAAVAAAGGEAMAVQVDLADEGAIRAMIAAAVDRFGGLHVLVNNAADQRPELTRRDTDVEQMDAEVWDQLFRVNLRGAMLCCKHALPPMLAAGGGSIINVASNLGLQGQLIQAGYSATKAALLQMTRSIATSHGKRGIRCNAVSPGLTLSRAARENLPPRLLEIVEEETLTPYLGEPQDMVGAVAFLASDEARYITGHNLVVDGGTSVHVPGFARLAQFIAEGEGAP